MSIEKDVKIEKNTEDEKSAMEDTDLEEVSGGGKKWDAVKKFAKDHSTEIAEIGATALGTALAVGGIAYAQHRRDVEKYDDLLDANHTWQMAAEAKGKETQQQAEEHVDKKLHDAIKNLQKQLKEYEERYGSI